MARVTFNETKAAQRYNSFNEFRAQINPSYNTGPSYNNLYGVQFGPPNVLQAAYQSRLVPGGNNNGNLDFLLSSYAQEVSSPTRNLTTSTVNNIGTAYKYATGQSHSEMSINFLLPRGARSYTFFERWMSHINNDATNYVDYFDDYTTDLIIYKFERGEGKRESVKQSDLIKEQQGDSKKKNMQNAYYYENQISGAWVIEEVFPYNLGSVTMQNGPAALSSFSVGFQYSRWRWFPNFSGNDKKFSRNPPLSSLINQNKNPTFNWIKSLGAVAQAFLNANNWTPSEIAEFASNGIDLNTIAQDNSPNFSPPPNIQPPNTVTGDVVYQA
tara:strand:- start:1285 stop:2265 length:981 start_codon:yes stop_codon:yes gene_type:complete